MLVKNIHNGALLNFLKLLKQKQNFNCCTIYNNVGRTTEESKYQTSSNLGTC